MKEPTHRAGNTRRCGRGLARGAICSQVAVICEVAPIYATRMNWEGGGQFKQFLAETHLTIECPLCGRRVIVETAQ